MLRICRAHTHTRLLSGGPASGWLCGAAPCRVARPWSTSGCAQRRGASPPYAYDAYDDEASRGTTVKLHNLPELHRLHWWDWKISRIPSNPTILWHLEFFPELKFSSVAQSCLTLCDPMDCSTPGLTVITDSQSLLKLTCIELVMPSNHLILCCPLLPPSIFPSIRDFSNESVLHIRWPKYWSFSFSISPSNEYSGLVFFRMHWLDLLAVQGTLKSFLQHHSSKPSILWCPVFFRVQLSQPYIH